MVPKKYQNAHTIDRKFEKLGFSGRMFFFLREAQAKKRSVTDMRFQIRFCILRPNEANDARMYCVSHQQIHEDGSV